MNDSEIDELVRSLVEALKEAVRRDAAHVARRPIPAAVNPPDPDAGGEAIGGYVARTHSTS